jgi:hypothetical protein
MPLGVEGGGGDGVTSREVTARHGVEGGGGRGEVGGGVEGGAEGGRKNWAA